MRLRYAILYLCLLLLAVTVVFTFSLQFGPWWEDAAFMWEWPHAT